MLEIKNIHKAYKTGNFVQKALDGVSIKFRKNEFVAILGPSGSGKTTMLNIIGGLDHYDSGDLIINGKSTKKFKDKEWDFYRNNSVGFIFQSYNLIGHISALANVEMALTLSNVKGKERKERALEALKKVGLKDHAYKKPNQLSGGQMQRVAIARSLVNNPDIILADEPTGALDSKTSVEVMDLIKEIAKDKLVIMVTHNDELAHSYANRVIEFQDGKVKNDSNEFKDDEKEENDYSLKKTKMSFLSALSLSFTNILTKKGRTFLTSFAASIGIIGIALVLSLSNGFDKKINEFEKKTLANLPISIEKTSATIDASMMTSMPGSTDTYENYPPEEYVYGYDYTESYNIHKNNIDQKYIDYIKDMDKSWTLSVSYNRNINLNTLIKNNDKVQTIDLSGYLGNALDKSSETGENIFYPYYFDVIKGSIPQDKTGLVLVIDSQNKVDKSLLKLLGFENEDVSFDDIMNKEIKVAINDEYYSSSNGFFKVTNNLDKVYNSDNSITLKISAIVRGKEDQEMATSLSKGIFYTEELASYLVSKNKDSNIVVAQRNNNYNVITGERFASSADDMASLYGGNTSVTKSDFLALLGDDVLPTSISISPKDFSFKEKITDYLDKYNENKELNDKVIYTDQAKIITELSGSIMDAITIVLIAFSAISLVVSSIMIGIITYISVLERTKEIGVLRALGARKKDISRVFSAETFIIGISSGVLGILIAMLFTIPVNIVIDKLSGLPNVASLNPVHAVILVLISVILTAIGGLIPAKIASQKDPVEALRSE